METLTGIVDRLFYSSPQFSAGKLRTTDGRFVSWAGKLMVAKDDPVVFEGEWTEHERYGKQFSVKSWRFNEQMDAKGIYHYLVVAERFRGIGPATAKKLVDAFGADLFDAVRANPVLVAMRAAVQVEVVNILAQELERTSDTNVVRTKLAAWELTDHQINTLVEKYGNSIIRILSDNPYFLVKAIKGFGFRKVDQIALKMGVPRSHPGRIAAGIVCTVEDAIGNGDCWVDRHQMIADASRLLILDVDHAHKLLSEHLDQLIDPENKDGQICQVVIGGHECVAMRWLYAREADINEWLVERPATRVGRSREELEALIAEHAPGMNESQRAAALMAMTSSLSLISGAAGTGKTYVLASLTRLFHRMGLKVTLCAPTGKAAKRMEEAIQQSYASDKQSAQVFVTAADVDFQSIGHYETLGIPVAATDDEIKRSYRQAALEHHPDRNPDDMEAATRRFQKVEEAYRILSDPSDRARYDVSIGVDSVTGQLRDAFSPAFSPNMAGTFIEAFTIHRLLKFMPREDLAEGGVFQSGIVMGDVIIVDEVSMMDSSLAWQLLRRIHWPSQIVVLVGDHNQLPPVGPGNLLRDLVQGPRRIPTTILEQVVRQAGPLRENSLAILQGEVRPTHEAPKEPAPEITGNGVGLVVHKPAAQRLPWYVITKYRTEDEVLKAICDWHGDGAIIDGRLGYHIRDDVQILSPTWKGPLGCDAINAAMQRVVQKKLFGVEVPEYEKKPPFLVGDKVIQTKNNYKIGVMNGTLGVVHATEQLDPRSGTMKPALIVKFDGVGIVEAVKAEVNLAYALTVHKYQGSQQKCVVSVVHRLHQWQHHRNLIYTSVTRASECSIIIGDKSTIMRSVAKVETARRKTFIQIMEPFKLEPLAPPPAERTARNGHSAARPSCAPRSP